MSLKSKSISYIMICVLVFAVMFCAATPALAQTPPARSATLTWVDSTNPTGTTYSVLRATGLCTGTPNFSVLASGVTGLTYKDTTITVGNNYCYAVTATFGGLTSPNSNTALATVLPKEPTLTGIQLASIMIRQALARSGFPMFYSEVFVPPALPALGE